jgi:hypothetical protein
VHHSRSPMHPSGPSRRRGQGRSPTIATEWRSFDVYHALRSASAYRGAADLASPQRRKQITDRPMSGISAKQTALLGLALLVFAPGISTASARTAPLPFMQARFGNRPGHPSANRSESHLRMFSSAQLKAFSDHYFGLFEGRRRQIDELRSAGGCLRPGRRPRSHR